MFIGRQLTEICTIPECGKRLKSQGLCSAHYETKRLHGDPLADIKHPFQGSDKDRFWHYVQKTETCWLWTGGCSGHGYGTIYTSERRVDTAHAFSYRLHRGEIPEGMCVCHKCDVRNCVKPSHLFLGTRADNYVDMAQKGRRYGFKGVENGQAKLDDEKVREIRRLHAEGMSQAKIARLFGVSTYPIHSVIHRLNWTHVD